MSMPRSWVDELFVRLSTRYGVAFLRQYEGADPEAVKDDWQYVIGGFGAASIRYALENLPADKPPTAGQFRVLCNAAPTPALPALPNEAKADPARVAAALSVLGHMTKNDDPKAWAKRLQRIELEKGGVLPNGTRMTRAQREMWRTALGVEFS